MGRNVKPRVKAPIQFEELEPRILFSAGIEGALAGDALSEPATYMNIDEESEESDSSVLNLSASDHSNLSQVRELLFIDTQVEGYQALLNDILEQAEDGREIEVVVLDSQRNGLQLMSDVLGQYDDLSAIHIISHGSEGAIQLGDDILNQASLEANEETISAWKNALSDDADILLYGCNLADEEAGENFVNTLAQLTGADVAASDDLTGSTAQGGDWDLEYRSGEIETEIAVSDEFQANYAETLAVSTDNTSTGAIVGNTSTTTFSHTTTTDDDRLMLIGVSFGWHSGTTVDSITYNGTQNAVFLGAEEGAGAIRMEIWALVAPDSGTHNVQVNLDGALGSNRGATIGVTTFDGVDQSTPLGSFSSNTHASSSAPTVSVTSAAGELVFGVVAVDHNGDIAITTDPGQTELWELHQTEKANGAGSTEAGAASVDISWSLPINRNWVAGGVSIQAAAADITSPTATISRDFSNNTDATWVEYSVDFSEDVVNVTADDFEIVTTGSVATNAAVIVSDAGDADASTYTVRIENITGNGTVGLDFAGANNIQDSSGNALDTTPVTDEVYTIVNAPLITSSETLDEDGDGQLDRVRITTDLALNDNFTDLTVTVAGYTVTGYSSDTANDNVFYVDITESGSFDTDATPEVRVTANTLLQDATGTAALGLDPASGGEIIFHSSRDGDLDIYSMDVDGSNVTNLTSNGTAAMGPRWSLDGSQIAYQDGAGVWVMDADGSNQTELISHGTNMSWSPDGNWITFESNTDGDWEIYIMRSDGSDVRQLTTNTGEDRTPSWSLDGTKIAWTSDSDGNNEIWVMDVDGSNKTQLTDTASSAGWPRWTVDDRIVYRESDGDNEIWIMDADGSNKTKITDDSANQSNAVQGPDGRYVYQGTDGDNEIYIVDADGSNITQLTTNSDNDGNPDWRGSNLTPTDAAGSIATITRDDANPTVATSVTFSVDFSEDVSNVSAADFLLDKTGTIDANATVTVGDAGDADASTYTVTVDIITGEGTLGLDFAGGNDIIDGTGNALNTTPLTDQVYNMTGIGVDDSASTDEGTVLSAAADGVLSNDIGGGGGGGPTAGHTLNFDASVEADASNSTWENEDAAGSHNWSFTNWGSETTHTSSPTTALAGITGAYQFSGSSSGATTGSFESLADDNGDASFELWFRPNTLVGQQMLFETGGSTGTAIYLDGSDLHFIVAGGVTSEVTVDLSTLGLGDLTSEFIQVVGTIDMAGNQLELYINGSSVGTAAYAGTDWVNGGSDSGLGRDDGSAVGGGGILNGDIAIFRLYESELSSSEVTDNYDAVAGAPLQVTEVNGAPGDVGNQVTLASGALLTMNADGSYDYDPNGQFESLGVGDSTTDSFEYTVSDGSGSDAATVTITINGVNDGSVITSNGGGATANINVAENTTAVTTVTATDVDLDTLTYSIDSASDDDGFFSIDSNSGVLTFSAAPDAETKADLDGDNVYEVTVKVDDGNGGVDTQAISVTVTDVDEFDVGVVTDSNAAVNTIAENVANGTAVGITASASDADESTNTVTYSLSDDAGGRFTIDTNSGIVTVLDNSLLNAEAATSHNITVLATSADTSTSSQSFTINVADIDEFDVGAVTDSNASANTIAENVANGTAVGITASASDADQSTNTITYSLSDDAGGRFTIDSNSGIVTVLDNSLLNAEAATSHNITVLATSADTSTSSQSLTINVTDIDEFDVGAVTDSNASANTIAENVANGTAVGITAAASDADQSTNAITYSLSDDAGGRFTIDSNSGIVTVLDNSLLNAEAATSHNITVLATSADTSTSSQSFTINVTDVDEFDVGAVTDSNASANTIAENVANGTAVGITAAASDADQSTNAITYSLSDDAGGRFTIDSNSGIVTVLDNSLLNAEAATSHNITVLATSADTSTSSQSFTINVTDIDEFDVGAVTDSNASANTIAENVANGTAVGITASASDADQSTNAITYSLSDDAGGRFTIDSNSGIVTVLDNSLLNAEAATSHNITVLATSADTSTSSQSFTINVTDIDEFDVGAVTDSNGTANSIDEDVNNGTPVGIIASATDADATDTVTYSLTDNAGGRFTIDANSGVVTVADDDLIDEETATSHNIIVRASSSDGSTSDQSFTVLVNDVNEFDVGAVSDSNGAANSVAEGAANGTAVGIIASASDADGTDIVTYSLTDNAGGRFAIDTNSGVVTVADNSLLDAETAISHNITVLATSSDTSTSSQSFTINVADVDEFDVGAVTDSNVSANTIAENVANGTTVGITAGATDADQSNNTITYSLSDDAGGRFTIDSNSGIVTVLDNSLLNAEAATSHGITVLATSSDTSTSSQSFIINITDVDEFDVGAVTDSNASANTIAENVANGTTVGITASASDADQSTNAITYSLSDDAGGRFTIDSNSGIVTVLDNSLLNAEAATSHNITVLATSADTSTSSQSFTINVTDIDEFDVGAVTDSNASANTIAENVANGTAVGITASASDADQSTNAITYSLSDDAGGRFTIDGNSGIVTVLDNSLLNAEAATSHNITVLATSADTSTSSQSFTINVTDIDEFDVGAVTDSNASANTIAENVANGTAVGITASASDADQSTNAITYSLSDDAGGRFTIDGNSGIVTVLDNSLLDAEAATSHNITVLATSADTSTSSQSFTINVTDVDEFDVGAVTDSNASANTIAESVANGTVVGITAAASDADQSTNTITYSLSDDAGGRFTIDTNSGIVTVLDNSLLNAEAATSHNITVLATSADTSTSSQSFTINVTDIDEFDVGAVTDSNVSANTIAENIANGTAVGITASASDADQSTNAITYSLSDDAGGRFTIDSNSGIVTVLDNSLLNAEAATSHNITVLATSADTSTSSQSFTINVTDIDEFDVGAVTDSSGSANSIDEDADNGDPVGIIASATDADVTDTVTYTLIDNAGGRFTIDSNSGVVTVLDEDLLDEETASSHNITVRASSSDGSTSDQFFTVLINDVNEFDVGAVSDSNGAANSVAENAANGTAVGIIASASDADGTDTVTYSLTDNAGGRFAIDTNSGVVTVADNSLLDAETAISHNITVLATSSDTSTSSQSFTINVADVDEFDVGAVTDSNVSANTIAENVANGTTVGITAGATDADQSTNTITYSLSDDAGGRFTIDSNSGIVTVLDNSLLNAEAATSHGITVLATSSDTSTSSQSFTINITDVDEFDVGSVTDSNASANTIAENVANGTAVGITATATDADQSNNTITYSLSDDAGGRFTIDSNSGIVTVLDNTLLDAEAATSHNITVVATSSDTSTSFQSFTINVTDVDEFDVGAVTDSNASVNTIAENVANGTVVGITASASDADQSTNTITYSLSDDAGGRFTIDSNSGIVTVLDNSLLNAEAATSHNITVLATSADTSTSSQSFTINVTDVDEFDVGAVTDSNASANTIAENVANGAAVGITASASDADQSTNTITYSLSDDAGGRFTIDNNSGIVTVLDNSLLNAEAATSHNITVLATSADTSTSSQSFTINVTDVDEFDVGAVTDSNAAANTIAENVANGTAVGITASATDADQSNNTITYSLSDDAGGRFTIDSNSGIVTVLDNTLLDAETATSHGITVLATGSDTSTSSQSFTINVTDVDEFDVSAVTDSNASVNTIAENVANGTTVGITAVAADADQSNNTITYSLSDDAGGRFTIDINSGIVSVLDNTLLDAETATSHGITVLATSSDTSTSSQSFTINITDVDEFDVGVVTDSNAAANTIAEDVANGTAVGITAVATDADQSNNTITYSLSGDAGGRFTIDSNSGIVTVLDNTLLDAETATSHGITVVATSSDTSTNSQSFTINVTDVDEFDVGAVTDSNVSANTIVETISNGTAVGITAVAADADQSNNTITYSLSDDAGGRFTIDSNTGVVTVADNSLINYTNATSHNITVQSTSSDSSSSSQVFTINITNVNDLPSGSVTISGNVTEDQTLTASNTLADADGMGAVSYQWQRDGMDIGGATNNSYTLGDSDVGAAITVVASYIDDHGASESVSSASTAAVINLNDDPVASADHYAVNEDSALTSALGNGLLNNDTDIEGDSLTVNSEAVLNPSHGTLVLNSNGTFSYTPDHDFNGVDEFIYEISDGFGGTATATVAINVNPVNDTPEAGDALFEIQTLMEDGNVVGQFAASDVDEGDSLSYQIIAGDGNHAFAIDSNGQLYVADSSQVEQAVADEVSLIIQVSDTNGGTVQATVTIRWEGHLVPVLDVVGPTEVDSGVDDTTPETNLNEQSEEIVSDEDALAIVEEETIEVEEAFSSDGEVGLLNLTTTDQYAGQVTELNSGEFVVKQNESNFRSRVQAAAITPTDTIILENLDRIMDAIVLTDSTSLDSINVDTVLADNSELWKEIDNMTKQMDEQQEVLVNDNIRTTGVAASVTGTFTAGFVAWILRGGSLMASVLSAAPLWRQFDPMPVLNPSSAENSKNTLKGDKKDKNREDSAVEKFFEQ